MPFVHSGLQQWFDRGEKNDPLTSLVLSHRYCLTHHMKTRDPRNLNTTDPASPS